MITEQAIRRYNEIMGYTPTKSFNVFSKEELAIRRDKNEALKQHYLEIKARQAARPTAENI